MHRVAFLFVALEVTGHGRRVVHFTGGEHANHASQDGHLTSRQIRYRTPTFGPWDGMESMQLDQVGDLDSSLLARSLLGVNPISGWQLAGPGFAPKSLHPRHIRSRPRVWMDEKRARTRKRDKVKAFFKGVFKKPDDGEAKVAALTAAHAKVDAAKAFFDNMISEKQEAADKAAEKKAAADKVAADKAAADKVAAEKAAAEKALEEKAVAEKATGEAPSGAKAKVAAAKAFFDNMISGKQSAADKAAEKKAAAGKPVPGKASADKATAEKAAAEKAPEEKAVAEKAKVAAKKPAAAKQPAAAVAKNGPQSDAAADKAQKIAAARSYFKENVLGKNGGAGKR